MKNGISNWTAGEFAEYVRLKSKIKGDDYSALTDEEIDRLIELVEKRDTGKVRTRRLPGPEYYKEIWEKWVAAHPNYLEEMKEWEKDYRGWRPEKPL